MPVVLVEKDPFVEDMADVSSSSLDGGDVRNIRRPLYGTLNKKDSFAHIAVKAVNNDGAIKPLVIHNSSAPNGKGVKNYNFIVQNFALSRQEKVQIIETFGDEYVFFYGERPTIIQVQGFLINTPDFNWRTEWYKNYEEYLRGTKCVERKARVYLTLDGLVFVGYILNNSTQITDAQPRLTPFSFSMLVTNYVDTNTALVNKQEDARVLAGDENSKPEYITSDFGKETGYVYNELNRQLFVDSEGETPESVENDDSAYWISTTTTGLKQFYKEEEAMAEIAIRKYMEDNSVSRFEAVSAFNSGSTIFSSPSEFDSDIKKSFGLGVQGLAIKV